MNVKATATLVASAFVVMLGLLLAACESTPEPRTIQEPTTIEPEPKVTVPRATGQEGIATEAVPEKGTATDSVAQVSVTEPVATTTPTVTIVFGHTEAEPEAQELLADQIQQFSTWYEVEVTLRYLEEPDTLMKAVLSGEVDVAALPYNQVGLLYWQEALRGLLLDGSEGFLEDAVQSVTFDGYTYGLPWRRSACLLHYYYLVMRQGSAEPYAAENLARFLTREEQQGQRYDQMGWFPTRECCYAESACYPYSCGPIECPGETGYTIQRLRPDQIGPTIALAEERLPSLASVLGNLEINTAGAAALIEDGVRQVTGVPVQNAVSSEEFRAQMRDEGAYVGALFVDADPEYPPGDYAVLWKCEQEPCQEGNSQVKVYLIPPGPKGKPMVIPVRFERFEDTGGQVGPPSCQVETGSFRFCWHVDGLRGCLSIGRR